MEIRKNLQPPTSAREKVEIAELNKTIKKKQLRGLRKHRTETIQEVQEVIKKGKGFKMAREKLSSGKLQFTGVLEEDSSLITDRDRIVDRAKKSMKIYARVAQIRRCNMTWQISQRSTVVGQACGQAIKKGKGSWTWEYHNRYDRRCRESKVPEEWNEAIIVLETPRTFPTTAQ